MDSNLRRTLERTQIDFAPTKRQPNPRWYVLAIVIAIGLSLGADVALVHAGTALFPSTRRFSHFRFSDYGTLTCIGVIVASAGWPLVIRISSAPRWLYLRSAVVLTLVLWLPDVWLFTKGEAGRGVAVLAVMHLAVALVTYNAIVRLAPPRALVDQRAVVRSQVADALNSERPSALRERLRAWWLGMAAVIGIEFVLGVVAVLLVPISRPTGWIPVKGEVFFALHGLLGIAALFGALWLVLLARPAGRTARIASIGGALGVVLGGAGGLLAVEHGLRLAGMGMMFVASGIAFFAYLIPLIEPATQTTHHGAEVSTDVPDAGDKPALT
jgi:hypothetical protein